jgi:hypothetical protein
VANIAPLTRSPSCIDAGHIIPHHFISRTIELRSGGGHNSRLLRLRGKGLSFGHLALELKIVGNVGIFPLKVDEGKRTIAEVTKIKRFIPGKDVSSSSLAKLRNCKLAGE